MRENEKEFYETVAKILNAPTFYRKFPYSKKTRWNNRNPGNGRFEGRGMVRMFSDNLIHVSLHTPSVNRTFHSAEEVYDFLKTIENK